MSRKPHIITLELFQEWLMKNETVYASSLPDKKLTVTMSGGYKVYKNGELYWQGMQPFAAIEKYNSI